MEMKKSGQEDLWNSGISPIIFDVHELDLIRFLPPLSASLTGSTTRLSLRMETICIALVREIWCPTETKMGLTLSPPPLRNAAPHGLSCFSSLKR